MVHIVNGKDESTIIVLPQSIPTIKTPTELSRNKRRHFFYSEFLMKLDTFTSKSVLVQRNVPKDKVSVIMTSEVHLLTSCINLK